MPSSYGLGVEEVQSILFRIWWATEPQRLGNRNVVQDHTTNLKVKVKVLDFVQFGGPDLTVDSTIFELWMGL